jgi:murein DD-endopeptidase MepM/ murein hydrolase activator NlpD
MEATEPKRVITLRVLLVVLVALGAIAGTVFVLFGQLERNPPRIQMAVSSAYVGAQPFQILVTDEGTGLNWIAVSLTQAGHEVSLLREELDGLSRKAVIINLVKADPAIQEGEAVLHIRVADRSYWNFAQGNQTTYEQKVIVDFTTPEVKILSEIRSITIGGSGLVIYQASSDTARSGVQIGDYFFPGYRLPGRDTWAALFAHPYNVPPRTRAVLIAEDRARNLAQGSLSYTLRDKQYSKSTVSVTDAFIENHMAPLLEAAARRDSPRNIFLSVNHDLRLKTDVRIKEICKESARQLLWNGPFHQLSNSEVKATFGLERAYSYGGEIIDHAYHLGYDLAVTKNYPVDAANNGKVIFVGELGIYGKSVIVDHGLGLFTLYGHMSDITVTRGEEVKKEAVIGKTGQTGLATGDHLHFGVLIHGVPVLPLEWWDGRWVKENISERLRRAAVVG